MYYSSLLVDFDLYITLSALLIAAAFVEWWLLPCYQQKHGTKKFRNLLHRQPCARSARSVYLPEAPKYLYTVVRRRFFSAAGITVVVSTYVSDVWHCMHVRLHGLPNWYSSIPRPSTLNLQLSIDQTQHAVLALHSNALRLHFHWCWGSLVLAFMP